ncbi:ACP S-malonyltransferase [Nocardia panacis]|uniref:[acyl-carrier-protein] S-malonyltransferase n=1 Tax=Nocardia panacis TaxID=2340916 RepID=A0A3A4K2S0_9NOCA|nr:ACP S-malonyltransferase [Nocardia panacis]
MVFPGQGIAPEKLAEPLARLPDEPMVRRLLDRFGVRRRTDLDLTDTRVAQPVVYVCGLLNALAETDGRAGVPATAGHSLGELTAFVFAGGMSAEDGFEVVVRRGELFHEAQRSEPGIMVVLMGLDLLEVEWLRRSVLAVHPGVLEVANINSERQIVLSGDPVTVRAAVAAAEDRFALARYLPVGAAAHSPLMGVALDRWRAVLARVSLGALRIPVMSGIDCRPHRDPEECVELLVRSLLLPVRWSETVEALRAFGAPAMWDAGPGGVLHNLGCRIGILPCVEQFGGA